MKEKMKRANKSRSYDTRCGIILKSNKLGKLKFLNGMDLALARRLQLSGLNFQQPICLVISGVLLSAWLNWHAMLCTQFNIIQNSSAPRLLDQHYHGTV